MYSVGEFAELSERLACLGESRSEEFAGARGCISVELLVGQLQVDDGRDEALLRAIVEIARETFAGGVGGGDDSRAGGDQVRAGVHDSGDVTPTVAAITKVARAIQSEPWRSDRLPTGGSWK